MSYQYGSSYRERLPPPRDGSPGLGRGGGGGGRGRGSGGYAGPNGHSNNSHGGRYQNTANEDYDPYGEGYGSGSDRFNTPPPPQQSAARQPPPARNAAARVQRIQETNASRQIGQVLEHIKSEWPSMCENECVPVQMALQLLDTSSVGRAHEYRKFQQSHAYLQDSLKNIVHEHHQGFNSSIGTYHKIQGSIQASQKRVRTLKDSLAASKTALCTTDPELKKLYKSSEMYDELLQTLNELEELRLVPDQLEARISEKRFLNAVDVLQAALRKLRKSEHDKIGALTELRSYLMNQEGALMDILVEELHDHLYLKSPYCQERWNGLAKANKGDEEATPTPVLPFQQMLDALDFEQQVTEDPSKNPEADTFYYIGLLVEALNKLGRLETAVDTLKQRLPVELFAIVNDTVLDMDQKYPASMRGSSSTGARRRPHAHFDDRETQMKRTVINDLLGTLYAKFEAIAEGHRVFHESIKALIRREGQGNNTALLGSFKELWNLYRSELRSLLHNYVTTEADVYQSGPRAGAGGVGVGAKRDNLFKFNEADPKSTTMVTEYEALDGIIEAAVPGLTSNSRNMQGGDGKKNASGTNSRANGDFPGTSRRSPFPGAYGGYQQDSGSVKSLVEPSVFNMSLLLPGTLGFLQRLKNIVPPGSDLATSTLTFFLDNILVNVFLPQVEETLAKHCDDVYGNSESFLQDPGWKLQAKKPIFSGTSDFFSIVAAFCGMLGTIPHDQALSRLILGQLNRYYERCNEWYNDLVSHAQTAMGEKPGLKYSAKLANLDTDIKGIMVKLSTLEKTDWDTVEKEVKFFVDEASDQLVRQDDIIKNQDPVKDRDTIAAMCLLFTSMKWLSLKVQGLRYITKNDTDSSRQSKPTGKNWTQLNDASQGKGMVGPVYLPMTSETVQSFDTIVTSYEQLATTTLLTLHSEERCRVVYSLRTVLSPETAAPYLLDQEVSEPDPAIIELNEDLVAYDEITTSHLREGEVAFMRTGLGLLVRTYLVANASMASPMNAKGCRRMELNILVLQQNLKNIEPGVDLVRATDYFTMFDKGADTIVEMAKVKTRGGDAGAAEEEGQMDEMREVQKKHNFSYDELKALVELCYSEQLSNPERGIATAAKRQMADRLLNLSEYMWQS
ncbi:putative sec8 exocyst complex component specific domain-containing protein [Zalerion maritima]|uniref:Exocyst complex component Sec8 n=1 Tax=Zalerion maritima TaxID=339359 RepID=A0AAD5RQ55_9PEZI|nr:putative sec8 exocyst complex component specific domain-containing protein [Zalerion maritima]